MGSSLSDLPGDTFNFLGYTFGRLYSPRTGGAYLGVRPSAKKIQAICAAISEQTERRWIFLDPDHLVGRPEPHVAGLGQQMQVHPKLQHGVEGKRHF